MKTFIYYFFKFYVRVGLFFYYKKITVIGNKNIPKEGAIVFASNHPNGLLDPLLIATHTKRRTSFLVQAAIFNNPLVASFFDLLGMMPIYRIKDGIKQLNKNEAIFNKCETLLKDNKALLIFPEGSHNKNRTIRPLSKGFTRIIFKTLDNSPNTQIHIVPVGITYQNASNFPSKSAINFGTPILANNFYDKENFNQSAKIIKDQVYSQLKKLSVHIKHDENYNAVLSSLNSAQVDFTQVNTVNSIIKKKNYPEKKKRSKNYAFPLLCLIILNSIVPFSIWKMISNKVDEFEFIDTFRLSINAFSFPIFYGIQSWVIYLLFNWQIAFIYFISSFLLVFLYVKLSPTPPSK
ncbi:lysophospholipid acyltransferase family protein [Tenacibaculum sp.]|uniref:lysophospholipid acyltransferase family protein n=1 Tax=Tenacibaculum sp. TaxID=1906242 RepID=UPI003D12544F